uniref:E3 ubiquitin-protein ligase TRIM39-like n=1 Tax=Denticeps clupeoides TaxID=299321 RepID=A0AAY4A378_9TELE
MASFLSEAQLRCSICLDVFTDPVSTPCGHNFCMGCIKEYWDNCSQTQCPVCKEIYSKRPELPINCLVSELADQNRKYHLMKTQTEVQQMIEERLKTIQEIEDAVEIRKEISASVEMFTALLRSIERSQAELLELMEEKQRAAERQAEGLIKDLQQEIAELQRRSSENDPELWTVKVCEERMKTLKGVVSELNQLFNQEMEKLMDVTLDPDSAQPSLILSADGKQVKPGDKRQNLPDNPERFNPCVCVLGKEGFSSGRFYYEVEVGGKIAWDLGVARESINRKGKIMATPGNGQWSVSMKNGNEYKAYAGPPVLLSLSKKPQKVGVFVDYEEGLVSFYDAENSSHIYSFTGQTFSEKLYPLFSPCFYDGGKNSAPLIISPVTHTLTMRGA